MSETTRSSPVEPNISQIQVMLAVVFGVCIVTANLTATKLAFFQIPIIGGVSVPAGFVAIAVAFLCSDLMAELYGKDFAYKVVNATVIGLVIAFGLVWAAILLPVAPFFGAHDAYITTLGSGTSIMLASIITTLVAQHVDVNVFHKIRSMTGTSHRWARNLGSTSVSQLVDTVVFIGLGFAVFPTFLSGDPVYGMALVSMIIGQYAVKLGVALLDTPVFYLVTTARSYVSTDEDTGSPGSPIQSSD